MAFPTCLRFYTHSVLCSCSHILFYACTIPHSCSCRFFTRFFTEETNKSSAYESLLLYQIFPFLHLLPKLFFCNWNKNTLGKRSKRSLDSPVQCFGLFDIFDIIYNNFVFTQGLDLILSIFLRACVLFINIKLNTK